MRASLHGPIAARAFRRHASLAPIEEARATGGGATLRTDEVSRHAVRLVVIDRAADRLAITKFARLPELLRAGDLVVVNDAATLPGSLRARTSRGEDFELRLSAPVETNRLFAVTLGAGDHRTRTEDRAAPPALAVGDTVEIIVPSPSGSTGDTALVVPVSKTSTLDTAIVASVSNTSSIDTALVAPASTSTVGTAIVAPASTSTVGTAIVASASTSTVGTAIVASASKPSTIAAVAALARRALTAKVVAVAGRRVELVTRETGDALWQALYAAGAPVQYAHRPELLPLYAVQTAYAARPWAAEMPSAGRPLTWDVLLGLRKAGVEIATLTHAAGLSSTGDDALDRALPWPERYEIPRKTVESIARARGRGGRVIAVGTTVVRALESAAEATPGMTTDSAVHGAIAAGSGTATLRLDGAYKPRVVDGLVSGLHAPGESHFELLSAFAPRERLARAIELAAAHGLSSHELGDACLIL